MFDKGLIGLKSPPVPLKITLEAVRSYTEVIGTTFNGLVPPTFIGASVRADIPGLKLPMAGTIHGEQKFTYFQPIEIGDSLICTRQIKDIYKRTGKLGKMTFLLVETKGVDLAGELRFSSSSTLIVPEKGVRNERANGLPNY